MSPGAVRLRGAIPAWRAPCGRPLQAETWAKRRKGEPVEEVDTIVVGAGPAGSAAAITLARAGQRVLLLDRAAFPREKPCGDLIGARALARARRLGVLEVDLAPYPSLAGALITADAGLVDLTPATHVRPGRHGRDRRAGHSADGVRRGARPRRRACRRRVQAGDGSRGRRVGPTARAAHRNRDGTGRAGRTPRQGGSWWRAVTAAGSRRMWRRSKPATSRPAGSRCAATLPASPPRLAGLSSASIAGCYRATAGSSHFRAAAPTSESARSPARKGASEHLHDLYARFVSDPASPVAAWLTGAAPDGTARTWPLDLGPRRRRLVADGLLVAGESAAFVGPLTGAGIAFALDTGARAGDVAAGALTAGDLRAEALAPYARAVTRRFLPWLRAEAVAQRWLSDPVHVRRLLGAVRPLPPTGPLGARLLLHLG